MSNCVGSHLLRDICRQAIRILEEASLKDDADEALQQRALVKLYLNRSMCALKLEKWDHAITFSNRALDIDPKNPKALYRYGLGMNMYGLRMDGFVDGQCTCIMC